jgi:hypothetical protein
MGLRTTTRREGVVTSGYLSNARPRRTAVPTRWVRSASHSCVTVASTGSVCPRSDLTERVLPIHALRERSSYLRRRCGSHSLALRRQADLYAVSDRVGKRLVGARHRGFGGIRRADRQDALPARCMHVGAKPMPPLRRSDGHLKPAMTTRPLPDHRITGTKRKLRLGHVSAKHTPPPPRAVTPGNPTTVGYTRAIAFVPWKCGRLPRRPSQAGPHTLSAGPGLPRVEAPKG